MNKEAVAILVEGLRSMNGWLNFVRENFGEEVERQCEQYDEERMEQEAELKLYYFEKHRPMLRERLNEWLKTPEMVEAYGEYQKQREESLNKTLEKAKGHLADLMTHRGDIEKKKSILEDIKKLERMANSTISLDDIRKAREYPIENIIEIKRGMALCVNHDDRNPSMNCKNNFVYCHSCQYTTDAIGLYQKVKGVSFLRAVKELSGMA